MTDPIEDLSGVDLDAASEALAMLSCPYFNGTGICGNGCHEEPHCRVNEPQEGWLGQLRDAVGVPTGWEDRWTELRNQVDLLREDDGRGTVAPEVYRLMDRIEQRIPAEPDPIESGREAALGQWEERWAALRDSLRSEAGQGLDSSTLAHAHYAMDTIEARIPTGLPVGVQWVPCGEGRVTFQLVPEQAARLLELLQQLYDLRARYTEGADAAALRADLLAQAKGQTATSIRQEPE